MNTTLNHNVAIDRFDEVLKKLSNDDLRNIILKFDLSKLSEIRVVTGYPLVLNFQGDMVRFDGVSQLYKPYILPEYRDETPESLEFQVTKHVFESVKIKIHGFKDDGRTGIDGTLHRFGSVPGPSSFAGDIGVAVGVVIRLARAHLGLAERLTRDFSSAPLEPVSFAFDRRKQVDLESILASHETSMAIVSRPGLRKTTLLRSITRYSSLPVGEGGMGLDQLCVLIDSSNEVAGYGDLPHPAIGNALRISVGHPDSQAHKIRMAIRNLSCVRLIIDELGYKPGEVDQIRSCSNLGIGVFATLHGHNITDVVQNPMYFPLLGLHDPTTRLGSCAFQMMLELQDIDRWVLYPDLDAAVSSVIAKKPPLGIKIGEGWS